MLDIHQNSHVELLSRELKQLLPEGSFSARTWRAIGSELHYRLVEWPDQTETEYSSQFPVEALFVWVTKDGGLDPEWLASEEGDYLDDSGVALPPTIKPIYTPVEQLAAYGLWLLEELETHGPIPDVGINDNGWARDEVIQHRAACLLLAYQALVYSQRIIRGYKLTTEEISRATQFNFSAMGKIGALKRHAPMEALRSWAIDKYKDGSWESANQAAHKLKDSIIMHGRTINAHLSVENAQRTIAEWFRKSDKPLG